MNYFSLKILSCLSFSSAFSLSSLGVWSSSIFFPVLIQFLQTSNKLFVVNVRKCYSGFHSSPALCPAAPAPADCRRSRPPGYWLCWFKFHNDILDWIGWVMTSNVSQFSEEGSRWGRTGGGLPSGQGVFAKQGGASRRNQ